MGIVTQEELTLELIILLSFSVFLSQNLQLFALRETDRYTVTHAKIRSAVGAGVGGALFDHLIL